MNLQNSTDLDEVASRSTLFAFLSLNSQYDTVWILHFLKICRQKFFIIWFSVVKVCKASKPIIM